MRNIFYEIKKNSALLFYCGVVHVVLAGIMLIILPFEHRQLMGANLWIKPLKFALSIAIYSLTWPLLLHFFPFDLYKRRFVTFTVFALSFEMIAITSQAARGELSHFNQSGGYNTIVYALMGIVITAQTVFSLYIGMLFFKVRPNEISHAMLWAIRLGILISAVFALQGGLMGQRMAHTVGAADGGQGWPLLNWSRAHGDLRIAHFFGLHALQVIPLFALVTDTKKARPVIVFGVLYFAAVSFLFYRALLGMPI